MNGTISVSRIREKCRTKEPAKLLFERGRHPRGIIGFDALTVRSNYSCGSIRAAFRAVRLVVHQDVGRPTFVAECGDSDIIVLSSSTILVGEEEKKGGGVGDVWSSSSSLNALDEIPVCHSAGGGHGHCVREDSTSSHPMCLSFVVRAFTSSS